VKLIRLVQSNPQVQLNGQDRIKYVATKGSSFDQLEQRIEAIRQIMKLLSTALVASAHPLPTPALSSMA
jgi:transcription-repair coupling factor (superfamily II helicase)